ncbi:MAG: phosphodiesterase [Proteobacteria bacterium]|nr:phosphodiesterase [Pseudomonadota bacterium]
MLLAHITDLHVGMPGSRIFHEFQSHRGLEEAVVHIQKIEPTPDVVVATGDLVDRGHPVEYELLRQVLSPLSQPVYVIPGNHDSREHLRAAFADDGYLPKEGFLHYAIDLGGVRLIALDTVVSGKPHGKLCHERLRWLDETLSGQPEVPTLIAMHHPPFVTGLRGSDLMGLSGRHEFEEILKDHRQVEHVIAGHVHRPITRRLAGCVASTLPSTTTQLVLDLTGNPGIAIRAEPPCVGLHFINENVEWVSHLSFIGDYGEAIVVA